MAQFPLTYYLAIRDAYLREMGLIKPAKPKSVSDLPYTVEHYGEDVGT